MAAEKTSSVPGMKMSMIAVAALHHLNYISIAPDLDQSRARDINNDWYDMSVGSGHKGWSYGF